MTDNPTLALYLRISADDGNVGDSMSIDGQRDMLAAYVQDHPELREWEIVEFSDDGYSGTSFERPGITRLLELVRRGKVNGIIVKDFSRFGRNYIEVGDYLEQIFPFLGVRFISVNDAFDSAKAGCVAGDLNIAFKNLIHDYYAKDISGKLRAVWHLKKERGEYISPIALFGYDKDKNDKHRLVIDEKAAAIVRRVFALILTGNGTGQAARILNSEGVPTPGAYKRMNGWKCNGHKLSENNPWTATTVYNIIRDVRYTGCMVNGKRAYDTIASKKSRRLPKEQWIIREGTHEAILSQEDFEKAQHWIKKTAKTTQSKNQHPLTGKVRCGVCGYMMQPGADKQRKYKCRRAQYAEQGACFTGAIPLKTIEDALLTSFHALAAVLADRERMEAASSRECMGSGVDSLEQLRLLQKDIETIKRRKIILYDQYCDILITKEDYLRQRGVIDIQLRELEERANALEQTQRDSVPENPAIELLKEADLSAGLTLELVDALVERILVYDDKRIEIDWKFAGYPIMDHATEEKGYDYETA